MGKDASMGLHIISVDQIPKDCSEPVDAKALEQSRAIVDSIRSGGEAALIATATKFGDIKEGENYVYTKEEIKAAYDSLPKDQQGVLTRVVSALCPSQPLPEHPHLLTPSTPSSSPASLYAPCMG